MWSRARRRAPLLTAACGLLAAGCSTFGPTGRQALDMENRGGGTEASYSPFNWSPPNYAGMTAVRIIYPGAQGSAPVVAEWISGKEAEAATVSFATPAGEDRKSVVSGKSVSVRVDLGGSRSIKKKKKKNKKK